MQRVLFCTAVFVALPLLVTRTAVGAPSEGETLFREGRAAMQEKDYEKACAKFAESQKKEPAPGTALNLGDCEEQRGHLVAASEAFGVAATTFTTPDKRKYAASRVEAVDHRLPRLTVHASVPVKGLVVHIGTTAVALDVEVKMDPGDRVVRAEAPGHRARELRANLKEGKNLEIDIGSLDATEALTITTTGGGTGAATKSPTPPLKTAGLVIAGVGAASLIVGGITGVLALDRASTTKDHCDETLACDAEGVDAASSGSTLSLVSTITVTAGAAALVGGLLLFALAPSSKRSPTLTPTASGDAAGLRFSGVF